MEGKPLPVPTAYHSKSLALNPPHTTFHAADHLVMSFNQIIPHPSYYFFLFLLLSIAFLPLYLFILLKIISISISSKEEVQNAIPLKTFNQVADTWAGVTLLVKKEDLCLGPSVSWEHEESSGTLRIPE